MCTISRYRADLNISLMQRYKMFLIWLYHYNLFSKVYSFFNKTH